LLENLNFILRANLTNNFFSLISLEFCKFTFCVNEKI